MFCILAVVVPDAVASVLQPKAEQVGLITTRALVVATLLLRSVLAQLQLHLQVLQNCRPQSHKIDKTKR